MLWIGITGPMGSGKSTVSACLREFGFTVLDADEIVRTVLKSGSAGERDVLGAFGTEVGVRDAAGGLDRRALGRAVFANPLKLEQLEKIIHPRVRDEIASLKSSLENKGAAAVFYDVPLLFEKKMEVQFDFIFVVSAQAATRLSRLQERTGLTVAEIEERWSRQLPPEYKEARASAVIVNNGNLADLKVAVRAALRDLKIALPTPA